eukprot:966688_1
MSTPRNTNSTPASRRSSSRRHGCPPLARAPQMSPALHAGSAATPISRAYAPTPKRAKVPRVPQTCGPSTANSVSCVPCFVLPSVLDHAEPARPPLTLHAAETRD